MENNPFDSAADAVFKSKEQNSFDQAASAFVDADAAQVKSSVYAASEGPDPERQAKVLALSQRTKLPTSIVESEFDTLSKKYQMDPDDVDHVIKNLPATADWLKNPENATLGKDDLKAIGRIEETVKDHTTFNETFEKFAQAAGPFQALFARAAKSAFDTAAEIAPDAGGALTAGVANVNKSLAQLPGALYASGAYPVNLAYRLAGSDTRIEVPEWIRQTDIIQYYERAAAEVAPQEMNESITGAIQEGNYTKAGKALALQVIANAPNQALLIAAGMANPAAGAGFALGTTAAGSVYENQENQIDPVVGVPAAFAKGTIEAGFESLGTLGLLHHWENAIAKTWGRGTAKEVVKDMAKTLAASFAGEGIEEGATNIAQDVVDKASGANPNALEGSVGRAFDAALVGGFSGLATTAPTAISAGAIRGQQTRQAERAKQFYMDLGAAATETKLGTRSPERQHELIQQVVKDGPVQNIYLNQDAFDTYFQNKNINPVAMAAELGIQKEYEEAKESGADLQIPTATFAQKIAATEHYQGLANDVKFSPDSMSINEAKADREAAREQVKSADQEATAAESGPSENQQEESRKAVRQVILDQLVASGYSRREAKINADTFGDAIATLAQNSGQTAEEVVQSFPFNVSAADVSASDSQAAAQNQGAIATLFQKLTNFLTGQSETEKAFQTLETPEERKARAQEMGFDTGRVLYHGTNKTFEAFGQKNLGTSGRNHGEVFFFTDNAAVAGEFADHQAQMDYLYGRHQLDFDEDSRLLKDFQKLVSKIEKEKNPNKKSELKKRADKIEAERIDLRNQGQQVLPVYLKAQNPMEYDARGKYLKEGQLTKIIDQAKSAGHDSVHFINIIDNPGENEIRSNVTAVFGAHQIRSVHAQFQNANSDLLLAQSSDRPMQTEIPMPANVASLRVSDSNVNADEARRHFAEAVQGKAVVNDMTGWSIDFTNKGKKKAAGNLAEKGNLLAYLNIDKLMKNAIYWGEVPDRLARDVETDGLRKIHRFYAPFESNGKEYVVGITVRETNEGKKFYDKFTLEKETPSLGAHPVQPGGSSEGGQVTQAQSDSVNINDFIQTVKELQRQDSMFQGDENTSPRGQIRFSQNPMLTTVAKSGNGKFGVYEIGKSTENPPLVAEFTNEADARRYSQQLRDIGNTNSLVSLINVFQAKDRSTFMHESAHYLFEVMGSLAQSERASEQLKADYRTLLDYVGVSSKEEIGVSHHEKIAEAWETYLMEGRAPSERLRKAFASFKVWLTSIYKGIPRQELTDAVRGVFDRMLVADNQIDQAEVDMARSPLFKDARSAGMGEAEASRYESAIAAAREHSESTLRAKLMDDLLKVQRAEYQEKAKSIEARVVEELNQEPVYKAKALLEDGLLPNGSALPDGVEAFKLNRGQVQRVYGGAEGISNKALHTDGIDVQMAAEMLGYQTADELIRDLKSALPKEQAVAEAVRHEMAATYPDLMGTPQVSDEAVKALHNKDRRVVLRMELEHLARSNMSALKSVIRRVAMRVPTEAAVREQAAGIVGGKSIQDIRPNIYRRAEIKAAKDAGELLARGDIQGAFDAKRRELLSHELFLAANEAKDRIKKDTKNLRKLFRTNEETAKTRDMDIVGAGRAILAAYGIGKQEKQAFEYLEKIETYDPETYNTITGMINAVVTQAQDYRRISYDQFIDMSDAVQAMWTFAKESREQTIEGRRMSRDEIVGELNARVDEIAGDKEMPGIKRAVTNGEKFSMGLLGMKARLTKIEHWAYQMDKGELNGAFTKYIWRPVSEAQTRYELARADLRRKIGDIAKNLTYDNASKLDASEIGYTFQGKQELIAALLHTGNESNFRKLLLGRKWGSENFDRSLNADKWNAMIARFQQDGTLTKADYDFVQSVWDLNEDLKPGAQKAHKKMYGYYFNEITAREFATPFGVYKGGYAPAIVDSHINNDSQIRQDKDALEKLGNSYMFPTTGRGFTKGRVEYNAPLLLDLQRIPGQMEKVLRFTHLEPAIKEVARIVNDSSFGESLSRIDPTFVSEALVPWLQRSALQSTSQPSQGKGGAMFDKVVSALRSRTSMQFMAFNIPNMVQNLTGVFPALTRVGGQHVMGAFADYAKGPAAMAEAIQEKSDYMKVRMGESAHEISRRYSEAVLQPTAYDKVGEAAHKFAYFPEKLTNGIVEVIVWNAAYRQHISQGNTEAEAVKFADATIRQVQVDASPSGASSLESGTAFQRLFTMFSMYFNNQANLLKSELSIAKEMGFTTKDGGARAAKAVSFALLAPAIVSAIIAKVFSGRGLDEDDDGHYLDDALDTFIGAPVRYVFAMTPGGTIANTFVNTLNDKPYDDKINISPVANSIEQGFRTAKELTAIASGNTPKNQARVIQDVLATVGIATGLPTPIIAKPVSYAVGVKTRTYRVHGSSPVARAADIGRGLLTGKGGN